MSNEFKRMIDSNLFGILFTFIALLFLVIFTELFYFERATSPDRLLKAISTVIIAIGVIIAVLTYRKNSKERIEDEKHKRSLFYLKKVQDGLSDLWNLFNTDKLDQISLDSSVNLIRAIKHLNSKITEDDHKFVRDLDSEHYKIAIKRKVQSSPLMYFVGFETSSSSEMRTHDDLFKLIMSVDEVNEDDNPITIKNEAGLIEAFNNGLSEDHIFELLAFLSGSQTDELKSRMGDKNSHRLEALKRDYPRLTACLWFLWRKKKG